MGKFSIKNAPVLLIGYSIGVIALFLYSFTQIDLSLTISRASWVQGLEKSFQYIGYFQRPLSTYLFVGVLIFLYFFYLQILLKWKSFSKKQIWGILIFSAILLGIAYNAFSYDLFNYIFDAKIFTHYHENPYEHKALDYAVVQEPMLSFMHWTHRAYPYGPVWLLLTIPLSYLGFNYFLVTFFIFKALIVGAFLGTVWVIDWIIQEVKTTEKSMAVLFFALNPFILIESVVSAHVDIVMMFFMMIGIYFLVKKKYVLSFVGLALSYGVKFASAAFPLPVHIGALISFGIGLFLFSKIQKKLSWETWFTIFGLGMIVPVVLASLRTNFQPWYLLSLYPFFAVISKKIYIWIPLTILSLLVLFQYVPYLYLGNWDPPVPYILSILTVLCVISTIATAACLYFQKRHS